MIFRYPDPVSAAHPGLAVRISSARPLTGMLPPLNSCISELQRSCASNRSIGIIAVGYWDQSRASRALLDRVRPDFRVELLFFSQIVMEPWLRASHLVTCSELESL